MRPITIGENRRCPKCGKIENQINKGKHKSGTQRCMCKECGAAYTLNPKSNEYPDKIKKLALKTYYLGVSGRGVGKIFGMSKANVYNWIKEEAKKN